MKKYTAIGEWIRNHRKSLRITQKILAIIIDVPPYTIAKLETGVGVTVSPEICMKFQQLFDDYRYIPKDKISA